MVASKYHLSDDMWELLMTDLGIRGLEGGFLHASRGHYDSQKETSHHCCCRFRNDFPYAIAVLLFSCYLLVKRAITVGCNLLWTSLCAPIVKRGKVLADVKVILLWKIKNNSFYHSVLMSNLEVMLWKWSSGDCIQRQWNV